MDGVGQFGSCPMQVYASNVSCPTPEVAAVNCNAWEWRLYDGSSSKGLVEVRPPGYDWGTVCDDGFSATSANKVCCALGFECFGATVERNSNSLYLSNAPYIHIDEMRCGGDEATPGQCPMLFSRIGEAPRHDCSPSEDVVIECELTAEQARPYIIAFVVVAVLVTIGVIVFCVYRNKQQEEQRLAVEAATAEQQRQMQQAGGAPGQVQQGYDPNAPPPPPLAGGWAQPPPGGHPDPYAEQPPGYDPYGTQQPAAAPPPQGGYGYGNQAGYPAQQQPQQV